MGIKTQYRHKCGISDVSKWAFTGKWILADIMESISFVPSECWTYGEPTEHWVCFCLSSSIWTTRLRAVDKEFSNPTGFTRTLWRDDHTKTHCFWQQPIWIAPIRGQRDTKQRLGPVWCVCVCVFLFQLYTVFYEHILYVSLIHVSSAAGSREQNPSQSHYNHRSLLLLM